jgi:translocation and assembly module TamB
LTEPAPPSDPQPEAVTKMVARRRRGVTGWFITAMIGLVLMVAAVGVVGRFAVLTPQGRLFLEARTSGLNLGRIGKLRIEGLAGDIWHNFGIRQLTISDEKGV